MKIRLGKLLLKIALVFIVVGIIYAVLLSRPDYAGQKAVAETRQALRAQGFKTDLADFDFSTSPEMRARESMLMATASNRNSGPPPDQLNLMEIVGNNSAIVVWQQSALKKQYPSWPDNSDEMTWAEFGDSLNANRTQVDAACEAALSGPIRFNLNASAGNAMLLPHLAMLKKLTQTFGSRAMLDLHDGNKDAAWTNLLASTRLVAAWDVEPTEISQLVRFANLALVFNATWQGLQADNWPDDKLVHLQEEWEAVDFFTNLPEKMAFKRASVVAECQQERQRPIGPGVWSAIFSKELILHPISTALNIKYLCDQAAYRKHGTYADEKALLLFYREREAELRNAMQAPTWAQMRQLPGVTNKIFFQSKYRSRLQSMMNLHEISTAIQKQGSSFLGRAAEAEAERRILITAIALERYRGKHGSYPVTLDMLAPEFLKSVPVDFMDGQPLRYRPTDDGHFHLYSLGLDCADHGGTMPAHEFETRFPGGPTRFEAPPPADIVWPLPASIADVTALRQKEERAVELRNLSEQQRESEMEWNKSPLRQARVAKILATKWSPDAGDMSYQGRTVNNDIQNTGSAGTDRLSLTELLTPKQIITGGEPEDLTFELPVSYNVATNRGGLTLLVDANPENMEDPDSGAKMQEFDRAANGDCLLVWHTIYDPPGPHAVQVQLFWTSDKGGYFMANGPAIPITTSNLCQFSLYSSHFDPETGAAWRARLPEANGNYTADMLTTNGVLMKIITGSTTNGVINGSWNLIDDHGQRFTGDFFNSVFHIVLPDSGREQTLRGP